MVTVNGWLMAEINGVGGGRGFEQSECRLRIELLLPTVGSACVVEEEAVRAVQLLTP
jgi:hypothetical protein